MEPLRQGESSIRRDRERRDDPHKIAERVQSIRSMIDLGEKDPEVIRLARGVFEPFARYERRDQE